MSRHRSAGSKEHHIRLLGGDDYRLLWTVDHYYTGVRQRFPRSCYRDTDRKGAARFAKKWHVPMPMTDAEKDEQRHYSAIACTCKPGAPCPRRERLWSRR